MSIASFRDLLAWLEGADLLRRVTRPVDPDQELTSVVRKNQLGPNLALLFENVKGSPCPVVSNVMSLRQGIAASLGVAPREMLPFLAKDVGSGLDPLIVESGPVQEVVRTGRDLDLARDLPQIVHSELDGGAYISAGIFLGRHPDTGTYNASWNRTQLVGGDHARVRMVSPQHLGQYHQIAEGRDQPLPAACVIGAPPALMLAASSKIAFEQDEVRIAGAWQGSPMRMVAAKTVPLLVPADAEMVIEGEIVAHAREDEGPFGEFMDSYVWVGKNHVFKATAITSRRDPLYHVILAGTPEDLTLLSLMLQVEVHQALSPLVEVVDVGCPGQFLGCVASIRRRPETDMAAIAQAAMNAHKWMKCVVLVDADVDPHNADDVFWALHTRFTPDTDIHRVPEVEGFSRVKGVHRGKMALDATYPPQMEEHFRRRKFPLLDGIRLEDYFRS